jgi:hypothetical protein
MTILYALGQQSQANTIMLVPAVMPEAGCPTQQYYGAKTIAEAVKSSLGAKGMDKMLVDSSGDVTITVMEELSLIRWNFLF